MANGLVRRYGKGTDSDATDAMVVAPPLMFGNSRGGPNSLRPGFTGDGHIVADTLTSGSHPDSNMPGRRREDDTNLVAGTLKGQRGKGGGGIGPEETLIAAVSENQRGELIETDYSHQLTSGGGEPGQGYPMVRVSSVAEDQRTGAVYEMPHTHALAQPGGKPGQGYAAVRIDSAVRRLTPRECERLQGFPDDWTALGPDSRRYAALGDAVTVPVAEWVGRRIMGVAA